jgi:hypothetical protein
MPAGKLGAVAGHPVWTRNLDDTVVMRSSLSHGVNVRSLKPYRSARKVKKRPDATAIREWRLRLRGAFRHYRVDCAQRHPTATELRNSVADIIKTARHFVESPTLDLADQLLERLDMDRNAQETVRQGLGIPGADWIRFKRDLRNLYAIRALPRESSACIAIRITRIDLEKLVPKSGPWRDPALFRLVSVVAPLWKEVTGRAAGPLSDNWGKDGRQFFFAYWLEEMHRLIGFEAPPRGRILDCTRPSGPRRRQKKPPSVPRQKA